MHEGDNPSFLDEFMKFTFSLQLNSYSYFIASAELLSYWAVETSETNSPPAEASIQRLKCKNFDAPDAHFDLSRLFCHTQVTKVKNPKQKCKNCERADKSKHSAMKLSQVRRGIELCMREIIPRFEMKL
jgi:hypothetical protein